MASDRATKDLLGSLMAGVRLPSTLLTFTELTLWTAVNACYNMLDRHCKPTSKNPHPGARPCIHYESVLPQMAKAAKAGHGTRSLSYDQVLQQTKLFAGVLRHVCGVKKGDRVLIYMPMCPEAAIAILATARLGAIHSVVFGGFAPKELAKRIEDAEPRVVVAASCGIEPKGVIDYKKFVDESFEIVGKRPPGGVVMLRRTEVEGHKVPELSSSKGEIDWRGAVAKVEKERKAVEECEPVDSGDLQYILYTSGSTGKPKVSSSHFPDGRRLSVAFRRESPERLAAMRLVLHIQCSTVSQPPKVSLLLFGLRTETHSGRCHRRHHFLCQ